MDTKTAFEAMAAALQVDPDYARTWHDNIAAAFIDVGGDWKQANDGARLFINRFFQVDTEQTALDKIKAAMDKIESAEKVDG